VKYAEFIEIEPYTSQPKGPTMIFIGQIVRLHPCRHGSPSSGSFTTIVTLDKELVHVEGDYLKVKAMIQAAAQ